MKKIIPKFTSKLSKILIKVLNLENSLFLGIKKTTMGIKYKKRKINKNS